MPAIVEYIDQEYLDPDQTQRHEPIVYAVSRYIIKHQGRIIPVKELCQKFYHKYTKGLDTKIRNSVEDYVADTVIFDKLIVSTHDGYLHPTRDQEPLVIDSFDKMDSTAKSIGIRRRRQLKRLKLDGQFKMAIGKHDKPIYEAFTDAEVDEYQPKKKRPSVVRKAQQPDQELPKDPLPGTIETESRQFQLRF